MAARKLTRQDLADAAQRYKNWGRWGPADEIGTRNHTSRVDIVAAARLVHKGKVIFARAQLRPARPAYPRPRSGMIVDANTVRANAEFPAKHERSPLL